MGLCWKIELVEVANVITVEVFAEPFLIVIVPAWFVPMTVALL